ncbi:MAG: hypothetical protein JO000_30395 [Alphaproteobacteria bacterium]|nr:hypothetical protein [Alphaproteobacteria bacterium]
MTIVPSAELIRRTLHIEAAYTLSRLRVLERLEGNPVGGVTVKSARTAGR